MVRTKHALGIIATGLAIGLALLQGVSVQAQGNRSRNAQARLAREVRSELMMLSNYSVFDYLEFEVTGVDTVVLKGQVVNGILKDDAEGAAREVEGVGKVVNNIEVLPPSSTDEEIRVAVYRAIFSKPGLDIYGRRMVQPIHIIVKNGNIALMGAVANQTEKDNAGIAARSVPGAFEVVNNLRIIKDHKSKDRKSARS